MERGINKEWPNRKIDSKDELIIQNILKYLSCNDKRDTTSAKWLIGLIRYVEFLRDTD